MAIGDDFSVNTAGDIRHVSGSDTYTVLELHRWLQDLADNSAVTGNDVIDITSVTPSERSTDNIITLNSPYNIDLTASEYFYDGSILQASGDNLFSGLVVVGSVFGTTTLQIVQDNVLYDGDAPFWGTGLNADAGNNILMRCMVQTRVSGLDLDGKRVRVWAREWGETYAEFGATLGLGNSVAAIFTNEDLNNTTAVGDVGGWGTITNVEGYQLIDLNNGNGNKPYYSQWNRATFSINQLYERAKWLVRRGTSSTVYGLDGELFRGITHEIVVDNPLGNFDAVEEVSWPGGTGQMVAIDSETAATKMWIQLLTGVAPTNNQLITGESSGASVEVNVTVTPRSLSPVFLGQSTGSAIIGGYGVGIEAADLTQNDKLFDLNNALQQPPNNVTFTVAGLITGEDYVLVGPKAAGNNFAFNQLILNTTLNGAAELAVVSTTAIPSDTPTSGYLRIELDDGRSRQQAFSSWTGSTFTIPSSDYTDPDDATAGNDVMIAYIDTQASSSSALFTVVFLAERSLFVRVRDGGGTPIKTFETPATLGSAGGSATAIRTSDE